MESVETKLKIFHLRIYSLGNHGNRAKYARGSVATQLELELLRAVRWDPDDPEIGNNALVVVRDMDLKSVDFRICETLCLKFELK